MLPVIIVGFAMITLGVALLFLGEVPFVAGRRISAVRSRVIGTILVLFLPLSLAAVMLCDLVFGRGEIEGPVVTWSMFTVCWLAICVVLFRVLVPKRVGVKTSATSKKKAVAETPKKVRAKSATPPQEKEVELPWIVEEPVPQPPSQKAPKKSAGGDPFDFS